MADEGVLFDERTGQRILAAVRYFETLIRGGGPGRGRYPVGVAGLTVRAARSPSGGIPAMTGTTPGSATCTFYTFDGTSQTLGSETATVRNDLPAAVDGNRKIKVYWDQGSWWFLVQSCT
jgi:hypothetical protein